MRPEVLREVRDVLKDAAGVVALRAKENAPMRTGNLAGSIRAGTAGNTAFVRSRLPQAAVHEYGGAIYPRGSVVRIKRSAFIGRAIGETRDEIFDRLGDGVEDVAAATAGTENLSSASPGSSLPSSRSAAPSRARRSRA